MKIGDTIRMRLNGQNYTIYRSAKRLRVNEKPVDGYVDWKTKTIKVSGPIADQLDLAETLLHESLHVHFPFLTEEFVESAAYDIVRVLQRAGLLHLEE